MSNNNQQSGGRRNEEEVSQKIVELKANRAVTAHYINSSWKKIDFVLAFAPLPSGLKKTSGNVKALVASEMNELGISEVDSSKMFITTDEGSNVSPLGGSKHQPCMCHVGSTMAKRTTRLYKNSVLTMDIKKST
uniref:Uncharacterized protein n=1 Tax=Ditylenchus dipsaci TaxID=166011 RepID=A0A915CXP5_9BILA